MKINLNSKVLLKRFQEIYFQDVLQYVLILRMHQQLQVAQLQHGIGHLE